jgi:hypothetical protein
MEFLNIFAHFVELKNEGRKPDKNSTKNAVQEYHLCCLEPPFDSIYIFAEDDVFLSSG